jgi:hypothetical protein
MNQTRKYGLLAMTIFGILAVADFVWAAHFPNERSDFGLTISLSIIGFGFLIVLVQ